MTSSIKNTHANSVLIGLQKICLSCIFLSTLLLVNVKGIQSSRPCITPYDISCTSIRCPLDCQCSQLTTAQLLSVDCSSRNLRFVPSHLPANTGELNLDDNSITSLPSSAFTECPRLQVLRIRRNSLSAIRKDTFSSVIDLKELYLSDNKLILNDSNAAEIFIKLTNLSVLSVHNNFAFNDEILVHLVNIKTLTVDRSVNVTFGSVWNSLIHLESLSIYGSFQYLRNETFANLSSCSLKELNVKTKSTNSLDTLLAIEPLTFATLPHLETLDLSYNRGIGFENVSKAWHGLKYTNVSTLILSRIISDSDAGPIIAESFYADLEHCKITTFVVSRNNIVAIKSGMAKALPYVRNVDFSYNRLANIGLLVHELIFMRNLEFIDFSYQSKRYLNKRSLINNEPEIHSTNSLATSAIQRTDFGNTTSNKMCEMDPWKPCKFTLGENRSHNIQDTPMPDFGPWCIILPNKLVTVNLSASLNVQLNRFPQVVLFGSYRHLESVVYNNNGISEFIGPFVINNCDPKLPLGFDASENGMTCISPDFMKIMIESGCNVGTLLLSNNDLGGQLEQDVDGQVFRLYRNLTELNLAKNSIKSLSYNIFENQQVLENLNLSGNSLRKIDFRFTHFLQIKVMDISSNLLTSLNSDVLEDFQKLFIQSNLTIDLSGNPIQCTCETLPFLRWIENYKLNLNRFENTSCLLNNTLVTFDQLKSLILVKLEFQCSSSLILKLSAGLLAFGVLTVAVSIFLYRHRWDIRYYFLSLSAKRHQYQFLKQIQHAYDYDAFVSYDHRDFQWVHKELMKNIENPKEDDQILASHSVINLLNVCQIKLCVHGRDFTPGDTIEENILTAIKASRKVLLVVTENFLRSQWCKFELEIARMESIDRGWNIIIPVLLTSVDMKDMPSALQSLVRRRTYIEWEQDSANKTEFWKCLRKALADPGLESWVCECGKTVKNNDIAGHGAEMGHGASAGHVQYSND